MISTDNLCMSCMHEIGDEKKCPYCGYYTDSAQISPYLPVRTVISNRYLVGKILEYNGEGATYIGWDITEKKPIKIREFIPDSFSIRTPSDLNLHIMMGSESVFAELRQSFEELWTKLARLRGLSALISVTDVVEDYGTSYAIYDHVEGITLRDFLLRSKTGYLPWEKARQILMPILSTLGTLHSSGIIHRGISPSTLIIDKDGKVKISGFSIGAARTARSDLNSQLFDGYAAIEQYGFEGQQGTWTDIYAFAAVLYRTLIGSDPVSAKERMSNDRLMVPGKFAEALPAYVINGLINALQILPEDRTRSVEQLRAELSASPAVTNQYQNPAAQNTGEPQKVIKKAKNKKGGLPVIITAAVISVIIGLAIFIILALTVFKGTFNFGISNGISGTETSVADASMVPVPDFKGKSFVDVNANPVFTKNFAFEEEDVFSSDVAEGYIVDQSITPETSVQTGTVIKLYVSKGKELVELPDVVGWNITLATDKLTELGFTIKQIPAEDGGHEDGEVIHMAPLSGKTYEKGTEIILSVYTAPTTIPETEKESVYEPEEESYAGPEGVSEEIQY